MIRFLVRVACLALALLPVAGCVVLEQAFFFHPRRYPAGDWQPDDLAFEDAWFTTPDGVKLHGWFSAAPAPRAVVLYAHGNGGNVASCDWALALFRERLNCSILVFDYRGYGRSEGAPSETGILADARAARRWLAGRAGVAEGDVVLVGRSLGGGVMVDLAAKDGARALVLENTFTSLPDVAANKVWPLPVRWLMDLQLDSLTAIRDYHGPLLQTHGDADKLVPFALGKQLFEAAPGPKWFVPAPGGGHNDLPTREYVEILDRFLGNLPSVGQSGGW